MCISSRRCRLDESPTPVRTCSRQLNQGCPQPPRRPARLHLPLIRKERRAVLGLPGLRRRAPRAIQSLETVMVTATPPSVRKRDASYYPTASRRRQAS